jgi:small subunit ribosomal protein S16
LVVRLRLKRFGRRNRPFWRLYASDNRVARDGRTLEHLGNYDPLAKSVDEQLKLNAERILYWVSVGAQPSEVVASLIMRQGIELPAKERVKRVRKKKARAFEPPKKKQKQKKIRAAAVAAAKAATGAATSAGAEPEEAGA